MTNNSKPAYLVYAVQDREDPDDDFWTNVGAAFAHKDKKGFNILLRALPVDGRLVARRYTEKPAGEGKKEAAK